MNVKFVADNTKIALSSERTAFKTESFIAETRKILGIDAFVSRVAEGMFEANITLPDGCFSVQTEDGAYTLFVCGGGENAKNALIFYKFLHAGAESGGIDRSLRDYVACHPEAEFILRETDDVVAGEDLLRLYLVSGADATVNFPRLNPNQRKIVETEDANMLVQGVAGSGKTNVCVEKIVYCACRNYRGKVLYSTFSRGLLRETKDRVELFEKNIDDFVAAYEAGRVKFLDGNHKKAVENKLGIEFSVDEDGEIISALKRTSAFLKNNVEYSLIEDIYASRYGAPKVAGESVFLGEYLGGKGFRLSGALDKIKNISPEIIYKEIYGMIFGKYELDAPKDMMSKDEYIKARSDSFTSRECEFIYNISQDYLEFLQKQGYTDNNFMSRELLGDLTSPEYSVGVIDEVQDFTQVNLCLVKKLCRKLFCVYGDVSGVSELRHNYRSTRRIEAIAEKLGEMNISRFGTHSFVLKGESVPSALESEAVFVKDKNLVYSLGEKRFENLTVIVGSAKKKEKLKKSLGNIEILTVAEAKGLERGTVILADVLSDNADKWRYLHEMTLNRKTADENSVFRYYFNLFYVGVSRAKQNLIVIESDYPKFFDKLFDECFCRMNRERALAFIKDIAGKLEIDDEEFVDRIEKFCTLEQYDNARAAADRLSSEELRANKLAYINIHEKFLRFGRYRDAGVEFWRLGYDGEAREMFVRSGDEALFPLMDACLEGGGKALDPDIVRFYPLVEDNEAAKNIILQTLNNDSKDIAASLKEASAKLRRKA